MTDLTTMKVWRKCDLMQLGENLKGRIVSFDFDRVIRNFFKALKTSVDERGVVRGGEEGVGICSNQFA
jgi:hypothetical protein